MLRIKNYFEGDAFFGEARSFLLRVVFALYFSSRVRWLKLVFNSHMNDLDCVFCFFYIFVNVDDQEWRRFWLVRPIKRHVHVLSDCPAQGLIRPSAY
jgi:hypothetical protein